MSKKRSVIVRIVAPLPFGWNDEDSHNFLTLLIYVVAKLFRGAQIGLVGGMVDETQIEVDIHLELEALPDVAPFTAWKAEIAKQWLALLHSHCAVPPQQAVVEILWPDGAAPGLLPGAAALPLALALPQGEDDEVPEWATPDRNAAKVVFHARLADTTNPQLLKRIFMQAFERALDHEAEEYAITTILINAPAEEEREVYATTWLWGDDTETAAAAIRDRLLMALRPLDSEVTVAYI